MRTDSIYRKLEKIDLDTGTTYVSDLMLFLGETEGDRFGKAAELVTGTWGFKTSKTALAVGYALFLPLWRLSFASRMADSTAQLSTFDLEAQKVGSQRMFEFLTSPALTEKALIGFLKVQLAMEKLKVDLRRIAILETKMDQASTKLQELRDPKTADDPAARQLILDRVDELMGIATKK
jgi:hypothetical protein